MAVVENAAVDLGVSVGSSSRNFDTSSPESDVTNDQDQPKHNLVRTPNLHQNNSSVPILRPHDQTLYMKVQQQFQQQQHVGNHMAQMGSVQNGLDHASKIGHHRSNGGDLQMNGDVGESFKRDMRDLEELFSKLNPMAEEFVPPSLANHGAKLNGGFYTNNSDMQNNNRNGLVNGNTARRKKNPYAQGRRRMNTRTSMAQREEIIRRTVYVSDIDHQVTEEQLAALFVGCGQVVDCRICGDPNSVLRFAFIEFTDEEGARAALNLAGTMLGYYPVRVLPSKTAIAPVNPTFLPRNEDEREMCARTIYCTNIDKKVSQADVKLFFESVCGEVCACASREHGSSVSSKHFDHLFIYLCYFYFRKRQSCLSIVRNAFKRTACLMQVYRLRLLGDYHHSTRIAFVEFVMAESAIAALNCSGVVLGSLPIRVSPSKTPVRPRAPRLPIH
ncbi:hypothetical protein L1049_022415 [Liquidambar formosana]|uniref:RRM domain-containing protein n=1 Tax=Liquidambar formosana TaxID=63359 RepID=A0AAP0WQ56_LIQFO